LTEKGIIGRLHETGLDFPSAVAEGTTPGSVFRNVEVSRRRIGCERWRACVGVFDGKLH
jgi:hypothetical protein